MTLGPNSTQKLVHNERLSLKDDYVLDFHSNSINNTHRRNLSYEEKREIDTMRDDLDCHYRYA